MTDATRVLDALGDPSRRLIVERLSAGPMPVGVLATSLPLSRPATSQHLKVLKAAGLVRVQAEGTRHLYRLDPGGLEAIREYSDRFWRKALADFADEADPPEQDRELEPSPDAERR
jgi:DNA-binding transcriptional ArsR family regulator